MTEFEQIVDGLRRKDDEMYQNFYNLTSQRAYFYAMQMLKREADALDALQDAYIKAYNKIDTLDDPERLMPWFNRIVANTCKDYIKKNKSILFRQIDTEEFEVEEMVADEDQEFVPEAAVDYGETKRLMKEILDSLSVEQKMCTLMFYYQSLSVKEIAEVMECSENTVKSRLNYARKKIKDGVLELEKKGTKLYGVAPIPFLIWMLKQEAVTLQIPNLAGSAVAAASAGAGTAASTGAMETIKHAAVEEAVQETAGHSLFDGIVAAVTKLFTKKVVATTVAATLAVGGGIGGKALYDDYQAEQELLRQKAAEDAILEELDEEFLKGLLYYAPVYDEEHPVSNEDMGTLVQYSMLYKYIYYFGDEQRMTMLAYDDVAECIHAEDGVDPYDSHITVYASAFDAAAQKLRFTTPIDESFVREIDPTGTFMKCEGDEITLGTTGLKGFDTDWEVSIDSIERAQGKIRVAYTLDVVTDQGGSGTYSHREALLVTGEQGYEIESIVESEEPTGAENALES